MRASQRAVTDLARRRAVAERENAGHRGIVAMLRLEARRTGQKRTPQIAGASEAKVNTQRAKSSVEAANALRDELLARDWPTSLDVGQANGHLDSDAGQWAKDKRDAGELLGVWSASERTYRHPEFQFDAAGHLNPRVKDLLAALANVPELRPGSDEGGWHRAFWLHGTALSLAGADGQPAVPAHLFRIDPECVIAFVRKSVDVDQGAW